MTGNVSKDSKYLGRLKEAVRGDLHHPIHQNIRMQAHHAISAAGVALSRLGRNLEEFQYDINLLPNLVFIPSTLQGACHLGIQPHRGNHLAIVSDEEDHDAQRPPPYHVMVSMRLLELRRLMKGKCPKSNPETIKAVKDKMDAISASIIDTIERMPAMAPLTQVAMSFPHLSRIGCAGVDSVPSHGEMPCPVGRDHLGRQGPRQENEGISIRKPLFYQLKAGH